MSAALSPVTRLPHVPDQIRSVELRPICLKLRCSKCRRQRGVVEATVRHFREWQHGELSQQDWSVQPINGVDAYRMPCGACGDTLQWDVLDCVLCWFCQPRPKRARRRRWD